MNSTAAAAAADNSAVVAATPSWRADVVVVPPGGKPGEWLDMRSAFRKLRAVKTDWLPDGLTPEMVQAHPVLEHFVCWSCTLTDGCGISKATSGGKHNKAEYYKVGSGKHTKYQAHKLAKCLEKRVLYSSLDFTKWNCSHLCHRHKCWNPAHMTIESHGDNMARNSGQGCGGWLLTDGTLMRLCQHSPPCRHLRILDHPSFIELDTGVTNSSKLAAAEGR